MRHAITALLLPLCAAWAQPATAAPAVRVAVIDSGVAATPTLREAVEAEHDMAGDRPAHSTLSSHGTEVATIIAQRAARPVRIVSLRVDRPGRCAGDDARCELDDEAVARAVRKAIALRVDVINLSLDVPYSMEIYEPLRDAAAAGIRIVMAAGNGGGIPSGLRYAQLVDGLWMVGAEERPGTPASFSARPDAGCQCRFAWRSGVGVDTEDRTGSRVSKDGASFAAPMLTAEITRQIGDARRRGIRTASR